MSFKVPFGTITITDTAKHLIKEALESKRISSGKLVRQFEERFAEIVGVKEAVAVSSGTDADILALAVLHDFGANRGDEVIVPALSFVATGGAVIHAGFKPVFVDVNRYTLNIDVSQIEKHITSKTRAIMPVHLMGKPADMNSINEIAKRYNLTVIEDAAEAHGAMYHSKTAGSLGDLGAFSTYIAHIITTGEGGVITTNNEDYAEVLRSLRSHGRMCACKKCSLNVTSGYCAKRFSAEGGEDIRFMFERVGYSCKMNELEAAIGLGAMEIYDKILKKRHDNLIYALKNFGQFSPYLYTIKEEQWERIGPHAIPIIITEDAPFDRQQLTNYLEQNGIETRTLFSSIPTQCKGYGYLGYKLGDFPNSEYIGKNAIHIGCHQDLDINDIQFVLDVINDFIKKPKKYGHNAYTS